MTKEQMQPSDDGEFGLSNKEFQLAQKRLQQEVAAGLRKGLERQVRLYFEFKDTEQRDAAMRFINRMRDERREFDEDFLYFEGCSIDTARKDVGIEIRFSKNPEHIRDKFEKLLVKQGLAPKEEYETVDGEPEPQETRINADN